MLEDANFRNSPGTSSSILAIVPAGGQVLEIIGRGRSEGYVPVGYQGSYGWIWGDLLI
ncbi:MAG: SH3 domain-containing protein [Chloroflexia bacterium]|nr:SH3 domain-containing protein [Chloroflexia bacterium]